MTKKSVSAYVQPIHTDKLCGIQVQDSVGAEVYGLRFLDCIARKIFASRRETA